MSYTTGTSAFNMEFTEIAEEAWERAGREMRSGYDLRTARRSMNLMTIEWSNRGLNMWTIEAGSFPLTPGLNTYALPSDTIDLLDHVIRTGANSSSTQADLTISRISVSTYATIPNKLQQARSTYRPPAPLYISGTSSWVSTKSSIVNLQAIRPCRDIRCVPPGRSQSLRILHWIHTQQQLRMVRIPALRANLDLIPLCLYNLGLELL